MYASDASPKQVDLIQKLRLERGLPQTELAIDLTKREASAMIETLLRTPKPEPVGARPAWDAHMALLVNVPDGRYAVPSAEVDKYDFYRLRTWRGKRFFDRVVGSGYGNGFNRASTTRQQKLSVAEAIAGDPYKFAKLFADKLGICARCLANLTDPVSTARGIGPECVKYWRPLHPGL